ncbi:MFS transporter [Spirochaetia bacterium]|nr:MFS transporter [Spirochaetia bacterium]
MYLALPFISFFAIQAAFGPFLTILLKDLGYSPSAIGILMSVNSLAGIAGPFIFGHFADEHGRYRPPMLIGHALTLLMFFPLAYFTKPLITALVLLTMSLGLNSILPLTEAITTIGIGPGGNYGKVRTPGSVSYIAVVLILQFTPFLRPNNRFNIVIWSAALTIFSMIIYAKIPSKYTHVSRPRPGSEKQVPDAPGARTSIWSPLLILGLLTIALSRLAMSGALSFFSLYVVQELHWEAIGLLNAIAATSEIPFMFFSKRIIDRFGAMNCLALGCFGMLIRLVLLVLFPTPAGAAISQTMHSLSYGLFHPAALAFISSCVPPQKRALGMSLYLAIGGTLPGLLGSISGGFIVDHLGYRALFSSFTVFAVLSTALALVIAIRQRRKNR